MWINGMEVFTEDQRKNIDEYNKKQAAKHGISLEDYLWNLEKLNGSRYYPPTEEYWS